MNQSTVMSLYIPHVFGNVTKELMIKTIEFQSLGKVNKIDFVEKMGKNGNTYNSAFVHFEYWYDNISSVHFQERVKNPDKEARIVYKDPWFWVCFENTGKKHIPGERKERIDLKGLYVNDNDITNVFDFEEEKNEFVLPQEIEDKFEREMLEEFGCDDAKPTVCHLTPYQTKKDSQNSQINMDYVRHLEMLNYKLIHDLYELRGDFIMV
jgi:hypothetical protein